MLKNPLSRPWTLQWIARFAHATPLRYVGNFRPQKLGLPLTKSWICICRLLSGFTLQGSTDNIRDYLPIELDRIKHASDKCLVLAKEVEKKFDDLMMLTGRILEVSLVAKGSHEDQLKKAGNILAMLARRVFQSSTQTLFTMLFCS